MREFCPLLNDSVQICHVYFIELKGFRSDLVACALLFPLIGSKGGFMRLLTALFLTFLAAQLARAEEMPTPTTDEIIISSESGEIAALSDQMFINETSGSRLLEPTQIESSSLGKSLTGPQSSNPAWAGYVACYARNGHGVVFRAQGYGSPNYFQRLAVRECRRWSYYPWTCRALGCRWL